MTPLANIPNILVIAPAKGIRSVKDLVAAAKAKPGQLTYASAGMGTATQLNAERFRLGQRGPAILAAVSLFALAEVFAYGARLREDVDATI